MLPHWYQQVCDIPELLILLHANASSGEMIFLALLASHWWEMWLRRTKVADTTIQTALDGSMKRYLEQNPTLSL